MSQIETLENLCQEISINFNGSLKGLEHLLEGYVGDGWKKYIRYNDNRYQRKLVCSTPIFDLIIISWKKDQESQIHDHPGQGCLMKVLQGELQENIYENSDKGPIFLSSNILKTNDVSYKENSTILHKILAKDDSVSIHIYSPVNYKTNYYYPQQRG